MFDPEFYPTPLSLIQALIAPYREWGDKGLRRFVGYKVDPDWTILEPSAGKGDIADYLADYNNNSYGRQKNDARIKVIEKNFELQQILSGKGYPIVGHDFLAYEPDQHFDLVIMNPPFSNGDAHLLHAWEVVGEGGHVACVLNAETIRNPHTKRRQDLAALIAQHGSVEMVGNAFTQAQRKTNVDVCIVRLTKPKSDKDPLEFTFEPADKAEADLDLSMDQATGSALAHIDHLGSLISRYERTKKAFVNFVKAMEELSFYGAGLAERYTTDNRHDSASAQIHRMALDSYANGKATRSRCNEFRDALNMSAWKDVLSGLKMDGIMTSGLQKAFADNVEKTGHLPLTKANIAAVVSAIIGNSGETMKKAVVEVFDMFTRYHADNRLPNQERWKTNKSWRCTKRVILPHWVELNWTSGMKIRYEKARAYQDIDKACCWLMGKRFDDILTIEKAMEADMNGPREMKGESEFFKFRYFKKGTVHLEFKDQVLLDRFNVTANENKNWLGDGT
jgi:hypothetical protein